SFSTKRARAVPPSQDRNLLLEMGRLSGQVEALGNFLKERREDERRIIEAIKAQIDDLYAQFAALQAAATADKATKEARQAEIFRQIDLLQAELRRLKRAQQRKDSQKPPEPKDDGDEADEPGGKSGVHFTIGLGDAKTRRQALAAVGALL